MTIKHLTIIGAGPKATAIVAKTHVLSKLGFAVPKILVLENQQLGAHWLPGTGYTNGKMKLGTPPEKDIGFPYDSLIWGEKFNSQVNSLMLEYSWQNFLIKNRTFSDWIDRGRPFPEHQHWAHYLQWVFDKIQAESTFLTLKKLCFNEMEISKNNTWIIKASDDKGNLTSFETDGVVVTGPGEIRRPENFPTHPHVMDSKNFWSKMHALKINKRMHIAIIGNGETASTVAVAVGKMDAPFTIDLIAAHATNYSRGESYTENHLYTDASLGNWHELTIEDRQDFIKRTDRGVFSVAAKHELDLMEHVNTIHGWFKRVEVLPSNTIALEIEYDGIRKLHLYDCVIFAMGYDTIKFLTLRTSKETRQEILARTKMPDWCFSSFERNIIADLSLNELYPKLHLPALAALQQGPGFPNLSCLGRLSDQILSAYILQGQVLDFSSANKHDNCADQEKQIERINSGNIPSNNGE